MNSYNPQVNAQFAWGWPGGRAPRPGRDGRTVEDRRRSHLPPEAAGKREVLRHAESRAERGDVMVPVPGLEPGHTASKAAALPITPYRTERTQRQRRTRGTTACIRIPVTPI